MPALGPVMSIQRPFTPIQGPTPWMAAAAAEGVWVLGALYPLA